MATVPPHSISEAEKLGDDSGETVLQKHVSFFDRNHDGVIYPWETFQGFRAVGSSIFTSTVAAILVNIALSGKTRPGKKFPNLLFPIEVKNIAKGKHGSDSGAYDTEGRFVPEKFEAIFEKHAKTNPNGLTSEELSQMLKANREPKDFYGWLVARNDWRVLYKLCKDEDGFLPKEKMRAVYDGTVFEQLERDHLAKKEKRK